MSCLSIVKVVPLVCTRKIAWSSELSGPCILHVQYLTIASDMSGLRGRLTSFQKPRATVGINYVRFFVSFSSVSVDPCTPMPCANNGNCMIIGPLNYTCECAPGYTGPTCDDEIDGCLSVTCPSNRVCVNGSGECVCLPGFQLNGGMCVELSMDVSGNVMYVHVWTKGFQLMFIPW